MSDVTPHTIELITGYTQRDKKGDPLLHRRVTFGKRINGKRLFAIANDPQSNVPTQYSDLILRASITEFGSLKMPVPLGVLLSLDSLDREDLNEAFAVFSARSLKELTGGDEEQNDANPDDLIQLFDENKARLTLGYERNGLRYDIVEFGRRLTGHDEIAADRLGFDGIQRRCYFAARTVARLLQSDGESVLDGPMAIDFFERLDIVDLYAVAAASELWRASFRLAGRKLQAIGAGADSVPAGA